MIDRILCTKEYLKRVAIIDDNSNDAQLEELWVEEAGLKPIVMKGPFKTVSELLDMVQKVGADSAICDHRLGHGYAGFKGAEAVAGFYSRRIPAILITQFLDMDIDTSIRKWRQKIPALLRRDNANEETVCKALMDTVRELKGDVPQHRRSHRALIRVQEVIEDLTIDALIPQWNPNRAVRFPIDLVRDDLRQFVKAGARFIAEVNTGALSAVDLFFADFELAPDAADI